MEINNFCRALFSCSAADEVYTFTYTVDTVDRVIDGVQNWEDVAGQNKPYLDFFMLRDTPTRRYIPNQ